MLGRQQIAGIPTAISEIFKNAHDAYASHVEADFLSREGILVIRDDGYGMTLEDFETRWLTLGTDSKVEGGLGLPEPPPGEQPRVMLGEKGIGRLAVAIIGPQVLILTRAVRNDQLGEIVTAFVNWSAFDLPGINLDEVVVPTRTLPGGTIPSVRDIEDLVQEALSNIESFAKRIPETRLQATCGELVSFAVNVSEIAGRLEGLSLQGQGHGTHFYISPTNPALASDLAPPTNTSEPSQLFQSLIGFSNTMTPNHQTPRVETVFRQHLKPGLIEDVVTSGDFFTPEDFLKADHTFVGTFNLAGEFNGTASIYGEARPYILPWRSGHGRSLECGAFGLSLAVIQGKEVESRLGPAEYNEIGQKLSKIGGLYIYKDGIRVLPYGRQDNDYLDIERNRTKGASYYYYSYRNIFGALDLTTADNPRLREKAGREGFQDNMAWRDFRDVLKNFFLQSAADFFRAGGESTAVYARERAELQRVERARRERDKQIREKRRKLQVSLDKAFNAIADGQVSGLVESAMAEFDARAARAVTDADAEALLRAETDARRALSAARASITISRPRGVAMSAGMRRDWEAYIGEVARIESSALTPAFERMTARVSNASISIGAHVDRRRRLTTALDEVIGTAQQETRAALREFDTVMETFRIAAAQLRDTVFATSTAAAEAARSVVESTDYEDLTDGELVTLRMDLEDSIVAASQSNTSALETIRAQIDELRWHVADGGEVVTSVDVATSAEEELMALRERVEQDLEMAQLGMAVSVIDHEFQAAVRSIRASLRRLRAWADVNPQLTVLYSELRTSFDHLDGYLTLFTPLQRRLRRTPIEIRGSEIASFLETLFTERFTDLGIDFEVSADFKRLSITGHPSTFYPVFVNVVDNDIFWLSDVTGSRTISLEADNASLLISDSGPGVAARDREAIFESGFSRKPSGRGLGLSISRRALNTAGYEINLDPIGRLGGATFRISPTKDAEE